MLLTIIISLVCVYLGYMILCSHFFPRDNEKVPTYPGGLPIIGHSHMWLKNETLVRNIIKFGEYALKVGGVTKVWMGPMPMYVVSDPVDGQTVLNKCLKKMFVYNFVKPMLGTMVIAAEVPIWKRNRRILDLCFKQHILDGYYELFNVRAGVFVEMLAEDAGKGEVDLTEKISKAIIETACRTGLGPRADGKDLTDNNYVTAMDELLDVPVIRINKPWLMLDFIFNWSKPRKTMIEALAVTWSLSREMVKLRKSEHLQRLKNKEDVEGEDGRVRSILDGLISNTVTEDSSVLTDVELMNTIDNVLVGSFDTTITEMLFTFICLGTYPEIQEKVYQEIIQVLGEDGNVTKQNISQLVYLEAAIKEALRLYPTGAIVGRQATEDTRLRKHTIPAGSSVLVHLWCINRNTEYWGSDADEFKPERWLDPKTAPTHKAAFATFSPGLRGCIGKTYAIMYMKTTMASVLRRFKFTADRTKLKLVCKIFLKPAEGHLVTLEERRLNK